MQEGRKRFFFKIMCFQSLLGQFIFWVPDTLNEVPLHQKCTGITRRINFREASNEWCSQCHFIHILGKFLIFFIWTKCLMYRSFWVILMGIFFSIFFHFLFLCYRSKRRTDKLIKSSCCSYLSYSNKYMHTQCRNVNMV